MLARLLLLACIACTSAQAQVVRTIDGVTAQANMLMRDGSYTNCGLRFVGVDFDPSKPRFPAFAFDFSLNLMRFEGAKIGVILKTEINRVDSITQMAQGKGKLSRVKSTWVQAEGRAPWKPYKSGIAGQNGLASLTSYPTDGTFEYMAESAVGKSGPLILGAEVAGENFIRLYRFKPEVNEEDAQSFMACAQALLSQAENEIGKR